MKKGILICIVMLMSFVLFANEELTGKVVNVIDGNTIELAVADNEVYKILLHGIDSPELQQAYGDKAKVFLEKLLLKKSVVVTVQGKDRWGNRLGVVELKGASDPRHELLKEGLAWTSERDPLQELEALKEQARKQGKGLWQDENPVPPWTFRKQQSMLQPKTSGK